MKKLIFLFFLCSISCYSQDIIEKQQDILFTFVYVHNQEETLKHIKLHFPEQHIEAEIAKDEFNKAFSIALSNINLEVRKIYGDSFESYISQLNANLRSYYKANKMTKTQSLTYLEQVRKKAKGFIESPIRETLISYQQQNHDTAVFKKKYHVKSYANSKKIDMSIELPNDWEELDGQSSSVLKIFRGNKGNGNKIISIQRNDNPNGISSFTKTMLLASLPPNSQIISSDKKLLNNEYIDRLSYEEVNPVVGSNEKRITTRYFIARDENIFIVDCSVYGEKNENLRTISQKLTPSYESIIQSIRFNNISKKNSIATVHNN